MKKLIARARCVSGIYHIVVRGVNRQLIFECDNDFRKFISELEDNVETAGATLYAYCLMENHVHILLKEGEETISEMMRRIEISYVKYFNKKYERVGPLYQGRFCSRPVENDGDFERVLKYIELNPAKAGLAKGGYGYQWLWTFRMKDNVRGTRDDAAVDYDFSASEEAEFEMEHWAANGEKLLNDFDALKLMEKVTGYGEAGIIQTLSIPMRDKAVKALLSAKLSPTQISRITGVNRTMIYRISKRT